MPTARVVYDTLPATIGNAREFKIIPRYGAKILLSEESCNSKPLGNNETTLTQRHVGLCLRYGSLRNHASCEGGAYQDHKSKCQHSSAWGMFCYSEKAVGKEGE